MARVYDFPLASWITMALHQESLNRVTTAIRKNKSLEERRRHSSNAAYIAKILREEVLKQFSDRRRPMLEVILNAIDARPAPPLLKEVQNEEGEEKEEASIPELQAEPPAQPPLPPPAQLDKDYIIRVRLRRRSFQVADNGTGMSLEDILKLLIIPFNTEKTGIEEIGRFGVGFLSSLNYCLANPGKTHVTVTTRDGTEGYLAKFYSFSDSVEQLWLSLKKTSFSTPAGTQVHIRNWPVVSKKELREYLEETIQEIPPYKAKIIINGQVVNEQDNAPWYAQRTELEIRGKNVPQQAGICIERLPGMGKITLTSQGVLVKTVDGNYGITASVSFPAGVQVVEGRDEFKLDQNYRRAADAVFVALERYIHDTKKKIDSRSDEKKQREERELFIQRMTSFIPKLLSAVERRKIADMPNYKSIQEALVLGKNYVFVPNIFERFSRFFGPLVEQVGFSASYEGYSYWREVYRRKGDFLQEYIATQESFPSTDFGGRVRAAPYPNLIAVARELKPDMAHQVSLVEIKNGPPLPASTPHIGLEALLFHKSTLYVNVRHPYVAGGYDPVKAYALFADFLEWTDVQQSLLLDSADKRERYLQQAVRGFSEHIFLLNQTQQQQPQQPLSLQQPGP